MIIQMSAIQRGIAWVCLILTILFFVAILSGCKNGQYAGPAARFSVSMNGVDVGVTFYSTPATALPPVTPLTPDDGKQPVSQ